MPYQDPPTRNPLDAVTSGDWNTYVKGNAIALASGRPRVRVRGTSNQTITNNSATALTFQSERFDPLDIHNASAFQTRIVIPTGWDGCWMFGGSARFAASGGGGYRSLSIEVNSSTNSIATTKDLAPNGSFATDLSLSTIWVVSAGDFIELFAYQNSGGSLDVVSTLNFSPEFYAVWLCPT